MCIHIHKVDIKRKIARERAKGNRETCTCTWDVVTLGNISDYHFSFNTPFTCKDQNEKDVRLRTIGWEGDGEEEGERERAQDTCLRTKN